MISLSTILSAYKIVSENLRERNHFGEKQELEHNYESEEGFGLDSTQSPLADTYEHNNEQSRPIKEEEFLNQLNNYKLL
jgi:hypothetical protein